MDRTLKMLKEAWNKMAEADPCWDGYEQFGTKDKDGKEVPNCVPKEEDGHCEEGCDVEKEGVAKKYQNPEGGLNDAGRKKFGVKRPVSKDQAKKSPKSAARRKSFCARMKGMKKKMTGAEKKSDPDSRINKSLRKWDC
jgi:hypothetical protein